MKLLVTGRPTQQPRLLLSSDYSAWLASIFAVGGTLPTASDLIARSVKARQILPANAASETPN